MPDFRAKQGLQVAFGVLDLAEDAQGMVHQHLPGIGQGHAAADALEQGEADVVFQLAQLHGNGGRTQMQLLGGARVTEVACGDDEDLQLAQGEGPDKIHC